MKILITGGAGYLGFRIAECLGSHGRFSANQVTILDSIDPDKDFNCQFVKADIRDAEAVKRAIENMDAVIHLAFLVGGPACKKDPDSARSIALQGTENVLRECEGKQIVFASSDAVYGNNATGLCDENTICAPSAFYGQLKLECEQMVKTNKMATILRLPTNFGYSLKMRWDVLVHYLAKKAHTEKQVPLSQGEIIRTLAYVGDTARAFRLVVEKPKMCYGRTFNVSSGAWKKQEIVSRIAEMFGSKVFVDNWKDPDARDFILDCSELGKIGWHPCLDALDVGLKELKSILEGGK